MKHSSGRFSKYAILLLACVAVLSLIHWTGDGGFRGPGGAEAKITQGTVVSEEEPIALDKANPRIQAVMAVQGRHTHGLMALPEVVGTATGLDEAGNPAVLVLTRKMVGPGVLPESLEGVPVVVKFTGEIFSMPRPPAGPGGGKVKIDPTSRFERPVPIGVSTGNEGECSAGTIGARVRHGNSVYALSNNHVYALENDAQKGSKVLQPGLYDTRCRFKAENVIGSLSAFVPIDFKGGDNKVDAAVASSSVDDLGNATPTNGYGIPISSPVDATVGQAVQKYGRTTALTKGIIAGINVTVSVGYSSGTAQFVDQIIVVPITGAFIKPGDSGSLLVTDPGREPVGLLFAGNSSGTYAIANPIDEVLTALAVTIDGD
jgi:hypothetical protein